MIQTNDLWKQYGRHGALKGLNLIVPEGSAFALIGANGAGKTTTIKLLMNILQPTCGRATIFGIDTRQLTPAELSRIGYVSENQELPQALTLGEYLAYLRPSYPTWDRDLERIILTMFRPSGQKDCSSLTRYADEGDPDLRTLLSPRAFHSR